MSVAVFQHPSHHHWQRKPTRRHSQRALANAVPRTAPARAKVAAAADHAENFVGKYLEGEAVVIFATACAGFMAAGQGTMRSIIAAGILTLTSEVSNSADGPFQQALCGTVRKVIDRIPMPAKWHQATQSEGFNQFIKLGLQTVGAGLTAFGLFGFLVGQGCPQAGIARRPAHGPLSCHYLA